MARANRYFLPNHVWHLTHRCHGRAFLLKFSRDREFYLRWLYEAKRRFGLCVLNYMVTSNHIHLLVKDTGEGVVARSMQLVAGRVAQEYNRRKARQGAFWEYRYHATAVESGEHLVRCLVYMDMNMVRAGVVRHPGEWGQSGYQEIQAPPERYSIIDLGALGESCGIPNVGVLQEAHRQWVNDALAADGASREECWSESVAVGSADYVEKVKRELNLRAKSRSIRENKDGYELSEGRQPYLPHFDGKSDGLRRKNAVWWDEFSVVTDS